MKLSVATSRSPLHLPSQKTIISLSLVSALSAVPGLLLSSHAIAQNKASTPVTQVVKPPIALAYIDVATNASDLPGGGIMGAAAQGGQSGGFFGALGGLAKGAGNSVSDRGNQFGNTHNSMGFGSGRYVDVSVHTNQSPSLTEATHYIPSGMNLGASLPLLATTPDKPQTGHLDESPVEPRYEKPKGKISIYWGCGENIRPGQPRTLDVAKASPEDYARFFVMRGKTTKGARAEPGHPSWPNKNDDRKIPDAASLQGQHSFSGKGIPDNFKFTLNAAQDLMPAIELQQTKRDSGIGLEWKSIPYARGYFISAMGGQSADTDNGELILWTSSELPDVGFGLGDYQSNGDIDRWINEKIILPSSTTRCDIPKGIFGAQAGGMLRMIAYGSDMYYAYPPRPTDPKVAWQPDWQAKIRVKSSFSSILGGMGEHSDPSRPRQEQNSSKEENKISPVDLLKGLFGR